MRLLNAPLLLSQLYVMRYYLPLNQSKYPNIPSWVLDPVVRDTPWDAERGVVAEGALGSFSHFLVVGFFCVRSWCVMRGGVGGVVGQSRSV